MTNTTDNGIMYKEVLKDDNMNNGPTFLQLYRLSKELALEEAKLNNKHSLYFEIDKTPKKYQNKYCIITVSLPFSDNNFYYATNYFKIEPNNRVLVYTGNETNRFITEVIDVNFYDEESLPYPLNKLKMVIQVFDSKTDITRIKELKSIVDKYPPIEGIKYLKQF